jgi:hypothetical protein
MLSVATQRPRVGRAVTMVSARLDLALAKVCHLSIVYVVVIGQLDENLRVEALLTWWS